MGSEDTENVGESGLRILSWNINGIRSLDNFADWIRRLDADILCFQETKITRDMLTEPVAIVPGYSSYFAFSKSRAGYSGVATYVRTSSTPTVAEEGLTGLLRKGDSQVGGTSMLPLEFTQEELKSLDNEGRCVITKHKIAKSKESLIIFNVYCPRADPEREDRKRFKLQFYKALDIRANTLRGEGNKVVIVGDVNTSHREIDHCDPYEEFHDHPGRRFLDHFLHCQLNPSQAKSKKERERADEDDEAEMEDWECTSARIESHQFIDSFRIFHPDRKLAFTCWNTKMNCRSTNYGTRIDYVFISKCLEPLISCCDIHPEIEGSDHCPVSASFKIELDPSDKPPSSATKYYPELQGKQLSIKDMFSKVEKRERSPENVNVSKVVKKPKQSSGKITNFFVPTKTAKNETLKDVDVENINKVERESLESRGFLIADTTKERNGESKAAWGKLFKAPPPAPLCTAHKEEAVKRRVTKKGSNQGREFYVCRRGEGRADDPNARCDFFKWAK
eukprot:TRINITY_DN17026_c0_g1_i1.p1 TRINITY_DN17026_c0_g1~~TRINITY_DN17026_c0_g1_i1.p1  ORF type:complete len:506 (+),score=50.37 TRINITY_DN17026_c0_g1_i1:57-1574(+)